MTFAELIRSKGFNQSSLSRSADVSQSNLSIYSNYRDTLEASSNLTRIKLSSALGMSLDEFEDVLGLEAAKILATSKQHGDYIIVEKRQ